MAKDLDFTVKLEDNHFKVKELWKSDDPPQEGVNRPRFPTIRLYLRLFSTCLFSMLFFLILRNHNHTAYSYFSKLTWDCSVGVYGWELGIYLLLLVTSLVAQMVKHLPTMWETWVQSLGQEDLLEKGMATHSSILAAHPPAPKSGSKKYFWLPWWLRG